jgi:tetratricopeptide (TPR) repeat protein
VTTEEPERLGRLNPEVPRDLETIVHKAIEREPAHRYATAGELAADLQRFLDDEPIRARRATAVERSARWARRNPAIAALGGVLAGLLIAVTVASLVVAGRMTRLADRQRRAAEGEREARLIAVRQSRAAEDARRQVEAALRDAEAQKVRADANFAKARAAVDDYLTKVSDSQLLQVAGMQPLRRELLKSALGFYEGFLKERGHDPAVRAGLAGAQLRVGKILHELGRDDEAQPAFDRALGLYQALARQSPEDREPLRSIADCWFQKKAYPEAIAVRERLERADPSDVRTRRSLADAYNAQGIADTDGVQFGLALASHHKALALREALVRTDPGDPEARNELGDTLNNLGYLLGRQGQRREALAMYDRSVAVSRLACAKAPQSIPRTTGPW